MGNAYVRSGAAGSNNGTSWTNAYTKLSTAFVEPAGTNFWVSEDHAETQATAMSLTSLGTVASPCTVICVNHSGSVPPVSADFRTTATITTTGANAMSIAGSTYYYGITFNCGSGAVNTNLSIADSQNHHLYFKNCTLAKLGTTGSNTAIFFGGTWVSFVVLDNTSFAFGSTGDCVYINPSVVVWKNTATPVAGANIPSQLFSFVRAATRFKIEGVNFSAAGYSGKTLFSADYIAYVDIVMKNCAVHSGLTLFSGTPSSLGNSEFYNVVTDSSGTNYRQEKSSYPGSQIIETTIVRAGGASEGVTPYSWKIVTSANANWPFPYESLPLLIWNNTTAANVTLTIYGIWGGGAVPTNRDIWPELSYLGASSTPLATIVSGGAADYMATATSWATDTSTWGGSTTKFAMTVTLSSPQPALKGPIYLVIKAAKPSDTFYIDPKPIAS